MRTCRSQMTAVDQLHQEADALSAVAVLCCPGFDAGTGPLEHISAAQFRALLEGIAGRLQTIAKRLDAYPVTGVNGA